jgi:dTDP-4-amino-4,6-dideoxygalactose transaminase
MQRLRVHAQRGNDAYALSQLQATVLRPQLQSLDVDSRKRLAGATRLCELLRGVACLMPAEPCGATDRPAFYKLAWWYTGQNVSRDEFLQALQHAGLAIDAGFRGFLLRSPRRCRKPADLAASRRAAEQTLLLHHPVLLRDADTLQQLATIITSTAQRLAIVPPA